MPDLLCLITQPQNPLDKAVFFRWDNWILEGLNGSVGPGKHSLFNIALCMLKLRTISGGFLNNCNLQGTWYLLGSVYVSHFPDGSDGKDSACQCRRCKFNPWIGKLPWRRKWQPTPVFLPGESPWAEEPGGLQSMGSQRVRHLGYIPRNIIAGS